MTAQDRVRWDAYYREYKNHPFPNPDPLLLQWTPIVPEGQPRRGLDVASGLGQNGLWMAEQGYITDLIDISRVALSRARAEATHRNIRNVNLLQLDFDDYELDEEVYDLVCVFRYLERRLLDQIKASVLPGGRLVYETFNVRYLELVSGFNPLYLFELGELKALFRDWTVLYHSDDTHVSQIVAVKPTGS